jgi:hypothetical protein
MHLGLLQDDAEWHAAINDAAVTMMSPQIRALYVVIVEFCNPAQPVALFHEHYMQMADDYVAQHTGASQEHVRAMVALDVEQRLREKNKTLADFGVADIAPSAELRHDVQQMDALLGIATLPLLQRERMAYDCREQRQYFDAKYPLLQPAQKRFVDEVLQSSGRAYFLDAVGGAGKTFCENLILAKLRSEGKIAVAVATSGIAATLLNGGRTAQGHFKLPIVYSDGCTWNVSAQSQEAHLFRQAHLFIWDETTMAHRYLHEGFNIGLQDIMNNDRPFGGKTVLFSGDFRQTLPIVPRGNQAQIVAASLKKSELWHHLHIIRLHENMRVRRQGVRNPDAEAYAAWLLQLGDGTLPCPSGQTSPSMIELPRALCMRASIPELIDWTFPNLPTNLSDAEWLAGRCILAPKNSVVDGINAQCLQRVASTAWVCHSADAIVDQDNQVCVPPEYLNTLTPSGLPPHLLLIKRGIPIMLLRNLNPFRGNPFRGKSVQWNASHCVARAPRTCIAS